MLSKTLNLFQRPFSIFGFVIIRKSRRHSNLSRIIEHENISTIFDIGANSGQFARKILKNGFSGKIISFEPTLDAHRALVRTAASYPNWIVHDRSAVGAQFDELKINVAGNSAASSSLLEMGLVHLESAPHTAYVGTESVNVIPLDSVFDHYVQFSSNVLLKIDVQGYERFVLAGISQNLHRIAAIKLELSIVSLYEGDDLYDYYFDWMKHNGFVLCDLEPGHRHPETSHLLQFDALFIRQRS